MVHATHITSIIHTLHSISKIDCQNDHYNNTAFACSVALVLLIYFFDHYQFYYYSKVTIFVFLEKNIDTELFC